MATRKVQMTGGSSYIITRPKEWVQSARIRKNDPVGVIIRPDGSLLITPDIASDTETTTREFDLDGMSEPEFLFRLLVGAYIRGYQNIILRSRGDIPPPLRDTVIKFTRVLIGPEIVEEDASTIIIKDLLNPIEMPFDKTLRRMFLLVKSMHENVMLSLSERAGSVDGGVINRDRDVDRLQWLVARQSSMILGNISLASRMGVRQDQVVFYLTISRILERVGDHAVIMAKHMPAVLDSAPGAKGRDNILKASQMSLRILESSMEAWQKRDIDMANDTIKSVDGLKDICRRISDSAAHMNGEPAVALGYIGESIRRTGEYATDISELLMNMLVGE